MRRNELAILLAAVAVAILAAPSAALAETDPPVVTCSVNPYNITTATVTLSGSDVSGVSSLFYRVDNEATVSVAATTTAFNRTGAGSHTILYWAADTQANTSTPLSASFTIYSATQDDDIPGILWASPVTGRLNGTSDTDDVYKVTLASDDRLQARLHGNISSNDFDLYLYGPGSSSVDDYDYLANAEPFGDYPKTLTYVVPPSGGGSYYLDVFGEQAFFQGSGSYTLSWTVDHPSLVRLSGEDRYDTAQKIALSTFTSRTWMVVASGRSFPDALAGAGLAGAYDAPLLLVKDDFVPEDVIFALGVSNVLIVGGTSAVSEDVETMLSDEYQGLGLNVVRIGGADRYATAAEVAKKIKWLKGSVGDRVLIARGDNFPDALALAPFAYSRDMPLLLVKPASVPQATRDAIAALGTVRYATVAGGPQAVSETVRTGLGLSSANVQRWYGEDRYSTAAVIARNAVAAGWGGFAYVGLATGRDFPDALAGGAACGARGGLLLLTPSMSADPNALDVVGDNSSSVDRIAVFGGSSAIADSVAQEFSSKTGH